MRRIDKSNVKIEHFRSQSRYGHLELEWKNLLAACPGGVGRPRSQQTCDTRKGDEDLTVDPCSNNVERLRYLADGSVISDDETIRQDLDDRLNLNLGSLKRQRSEVLRSLRAGLERKLGARRTWTSARLRKELDDLRSCQRLREFLGVYEYWIEKRIVRKR